MSLYLFFDSFIPTFVTAKVIIYFLIPTND